MTISDWSARLILGESIEVMRTLDEASVDAIVCDPPYSLGFMGKTWDTHRGPKGFQDWCEAWATEAFRVLKPGGHLLAFGGTRTYHRLATGLEDAGFEIRDSLHWIYGSGFPKALDVSKAIDQSLGVERSDRVVSGPGENKVFSPTQSVKNPGIPVTAAAAAWEGWSTGLKPAHEPIVMARKPILGTVVENVLEHGTGALHIASTRVGKDGGASAVPGSRSKVDGSTNFPGRAEMVSLDAGRWPANVLLAHLASCEGSGSEHTESLCAPGCPVAELNASQVGAARFFYIAKPRARERIGGTIRNLHPTVKPIDLMRHLVRLVTPPDGLVLDPFLGSGTTGCAAISEGFRFLGIEMEPASYDTSFARISDYAFACGRPKPLAE